MISRRGLITGLVSLVAAPAIVRVASLMSVKVMEPDLSGTYLRLVMQGVRAEYSVAEFLEAQQRLNRWKSAMLSRDGHTYFIDADNNVHCYDEAADEAFFAGEQWTPQQIDGFKAARIS